MNKLLSLISTSDRLTLISLLTTILSLAFILLSFLIVYQSLPSKIPLYYSLPWGENQLVTKSQFLIIPVILIFITLTNFLITTQIHSAQKILRKILLFNTPFISLILLLTVLKILSIFI